jgi:hypothetical protein
VAKGTHPSEVEEPGLGAIVMIDYGFARGGALRSSMYIHTSEGWSLHPDGRRSITWARLMDLDGLNARLLASDPSLGEIEGCRITGLGFAPVALLDSLMGERGGEDLAHPRFLDELMEENRG